MKRLTLIICALTAFIGAQAAQTKTYDLTICNYDTMFFAENNDVYMILYTEDYEATLRLDIKVEEGQRFFTNGKTYTWDDMIHKFCYAYVKDEYREYLFADASFTWRLDELGLEHFAGTATDSVGNVYNFHYDVLPYIPTGDTIEVSFSQSLRMEHTKDWYFYGEEGEYNIMLTLINEGSSPAGHYTEKNIDVDYSYIDKSLGEGNYELLFFHHADIDVTEAAGDTFKIEALIAAMDTNVYRFHLYYVEPKPLTKKTITATDLYINTDYLYGMVGAFKVEASDDTHSVTLAISPMTEDLSIYDTFTITNASVNMGYINEEPDPDTPIDVYKGTVTIAKTEEGAVVTGTLLCYNNTEYTLDLSYAVPEETREASLSIDGMLLQKSTQGAWRISGYSADSTQYVSLVFNGFGIAGDYSYVEMSPDYSYVVTDIVWDSKTSTESYNYFSVIDAKLKAEFNETDSVVTVTGMVLAQNMNDIPLFTVQLSTRASQEEAICQLFTPGVATKRIENGIFIIEKNGSKYTLTGHVIK